MNFILNGTGKKKQPYKKQHPKKIKVAHHNDRRHKSTVDACSTIRMYITLSLSLPFSVAPNISYHIRRETTVKQFQLKLKTLQNFVQCLCYSFFFSVEEEKAIHTRIEKRNKKKKKKNADIRQPKYC